MNSQPSRSSHLILLPLVGILVVLLLGCAPCCCWPGGWHDLKDIDTGGGATVSGTAYITTDGQKTPVPDLNVTLSNSATTTNRYKATTDTSGYFLMTNVEPGTYFIRLAGGDLGWTKTIDVEKGLSLNLGDIQLHPTLPPPDANSTTEKYPVTPEDVIKAYYKAINNGDYSKALSFVAGQLSSVELDTIRGQYEPYVKNIEVVSIERRASMDYNNRQIYFVTFSAEYIKHYEAGSGDLQRTHALQKINGFWKIVDIGTG